MFIMIVANVHAATGDYALVGSTSKGNRDFGIYYSAKNGEFLYKQVKRPNSNSPKFSFPVNLTYIDQSLGRPQGYKLSENKRYPAHTLVQFDSSYRNLLKDLDDHNVHLGQELVAAQRTALREKMNKFIKVKSRRVDGKNRIAYFNFDTGEVIYQEIKTEDGRQYITKEKFFDLNNPQDFAEARKYLRDRGLLWERTTDGLKAMLVGPCGQNRQGIDLGINFSDFNSITDALFEKYLQSALSKEVIPTDNREVIMKVSVLDKEYQVKASLGSNGKVTDLKFLNPVLAQQNGLTIEEEVDARGEKHFHIKAKDPSDNERKTFIALTSGSLRNTANGPMIHLKASVRGKQDGSFSYNGFEPSIYELYFTNDMSGIRGAGQRQRLTGEDRDSYDISHEVGGSGGFFNFIFSNFMSTSSQSNEVRKKIAEEAGKAILSNDGFKSLTNQAEINAMAAKITENVRLRTNNYNASLGKVEAIAAEEAYGTFGSLLLRRTLSNLLPEEKRSDLDGVMNVTMGEFKKCMRAASDRRSRDGVTKCMNVFEKEAPVDVGRAVLDLKLKQAGMDPYKDLYVKEYNKCIKENYDPLLVNAREGELVDGESAVKGCVFQTILITVDKGIGPELDKRVAEIGAENGGTPIRLSADRKSSALQTASKCFQRKGLMAQGSYQLNFDYKYLSNMDATKYEHDLSDCLDEVTLNVGRVVAQAKIQAEVGGVLAPSEGEEPIPNMNLVVEDIANHAVLNGYETCVRQQRQIISKAKVAYQAEKEQLINAAINPNNVSRPTTYVPTFDPLLCTELITSMSVQKASSEMIKQKLGAEKWKQLVEDADQIPDFMACYANHQKDIRSNFATQFASKPYYLSLPIDQRESEKKKYEEKKAAESEKRNAACLKETISWSSFHLAKDMLGTAIAEMKDDFGEITLSPENLELFSGKIQSCFNKELQKYNTVAEVGDSIEPVTNTCAMKLIKEDRDFEKQVLKPIMKLTLEDSGIKGEDNDKYADLLIKDLREFLNEEKVHSLDEFKLASKKYKTRGTIKVVTMAIDDKINGQLKGSSPEVAAKIKSELIPELDKLISQGEGSLKFKLEKAATSDDPNASKKIIAGFTIDATKLIAGKVLEVEKDKLIAEGTLASNLGEGFVAHTKAKLDQCIAAINRNQFDKVEDKLNNCTQDLKMHGTTWVVGKTLDKELSDPSITSELTPGEIAAVKAQIMDQNFKDQVRAISRIEDSEQSAIRLKLLISDLTTNATKTIATALVPKTINKALKLKADSPAEVKAISRRIIGESTGSLVSCMNKANADNKKVINGDTSIKLSNGKPFDFKKASDSCVNLMRRLASKEVLKHEFSSTMDFIDLTSQARADLIKGQLASFESCANGVDNYKSSNDYSAEIEACLSISALGFAEKAVMRAREVGNDMLRPRAGTMMAYNQCINDTIKSNGNKQLELFNAQSPAVKSLIQRSSSLSVDAYIKEAAILSSKLKDQTGKNLERITVNWTSERMKKCFFDSLASNLFDEFKDGIFNSPKYNLAARDKENISLLVDGFKDIMTMPGPDNGNIRLKTGGNSSSGSGSGAEPVVTPKTTVLEDVREFLPTIVEYIKLVGNYDSVRSKDNLKLLIARIKDKVRANGGVLDMDQVIDLAMESELMADIIKAVISKEVKVTSEKALRSFITNSAERRRISDKLASKQMIDHIFRNSDPKAKQILDMIKKDYIKKLIKGEISSSEGIPKSIMDKVKLHLASDTRIGGFAETILAPIAQEGLDEAEDGWVAGFGMLIGRVSSNDFNWTTLRNRSGGKRVINKFSSDILKPLLTDNLSDSQLKKREKELKELISDTVKDNEGDYNPFW
jgi:hypothetical protein